MSEIPLVGVGLNVSLTPLVGVGLNVSVIPLVGVGLNVNTPLVGVGLYVAAELIIGLLVGAFVGNAASQSDSMQKMSTATSIAQTSRFTELTITDLTANKQTSSIYPSCKDTTMASGHLVVPFTRKRRWKRHSSNESSVGRVYT